MLEENTRIQYFDTAKGLCILLVVTHHIMDSYCDCDYPLRITLMNIRMPLYFCLSGIFFKKYDGFMSFLAKKINRLLIPFLFFYMIFAVCVPYVVGVYTGEELWQGFPTSPFICLITAFIYNEAFQDGAIWFLLCLFEANIFFYLLQTFSRFFKVYSDTALAVCVMISGFTGITLNKLNINLYCFMDTALSVLPFFYAGYCLKTKTLFMTRFVGNSKLFISSVLLFVMIAFLSSPVDYRINEFSDYSFITAYPCGVLGSIMIINISRLVGNIKFLSYIGRYSIIILCIHIVIFTYIVESLCCLEWNVSVKFFTCLSLTLLISIVFIPIIKKYLPFVSAQKDLI